MEANIKISRQMGARRIDFVYYIWSTLDDHIYGESLLMIKAVENLYFQ